MSEKAPVQVTVLRDSFNGTYSGNSNAEVAAAIAKDLDLIVDSLIALDQAILAKTAGGAVVGTPQNQPQPSSVNTPPPANGASDDPCEAVHGPREQRAGVKNGKAWTGRFCVANDSSHKPIWGK